MNRRPFEFAVIADDLTGALDTGLQFRKKGFRTLVPLRVNPPWPSTEALVLNTDSRNIPGLLAYRRILRICRPLKAKALYKKIDSTMRGNVGLEVEAILKAQGIPKAIVVPSIPILGRTVEKGILKVNGIPPTQNPLRPGPLPPSFKFSGGTNSFNGNLPPCRPYSPGSSPQGSGIPGGP